MRWDPTDPVQVTPHALTRWRERIDRHTTQSDRDLAAALVAALRTQPPDAGTVKPGADGRPALYISVHDQPGGRGWTAKLGPALGDGWIMHTVTRRHGPSSNQAERRRRDRRAWDRWVTWCAEHTESPVGNPDGLRRLRTEMDGHITSTTRNMSRVVLARWAEILGCDRDEFAYQLTEIRTAAGKTVHW